MDKGNRSGLKEGLTIFTNILTETLRKSLELNDRPEQPPIITINAWNEWVEGSYLEPDMKWGYGYLEAVKKVMSGKYDKY
jgi:hypothetical protein